ncbi:MAG: T9SS type A sorting domain-containing protein [Melioribacteraceae bacterium]|nr:T9SS type A sorting domain-containing protein [Melioribacteraceae bacterium]
MKKCLLLTLLFICSSFYAQTYPTVKISDIQFIDDIANTGDVASPRDGDTLTIEGVVTVAPVVDAQNDRRPIIWAGGRWSVYMQDVDGQPWGGMLVLQDDTTGVNQNTFFDLVDTAQVIRVTGVVSEYISTTEFFVLLDPIAPVEVISQLPKRPDPVEVSMDALMNGGEKNPEGEKYEGMYVILKNFTTSDRNVTNGYFRLNDGNGNHLMVYTQSSFFKVASDGNRLTGLTDYEPPVDGSAIEYIRGALTTREDTYYIVPLYPGDIKVGAAPPTISSIHRNTAIALPDTDVEITSKIYDADGTVARADLHYRVDGGSLNHVQMNTSGDSVYSATIPAVFQDDVIIDYYLTAQDDLGNITVEPADTVAGKLFFFAKTSSPDIKDIQYSPFGSGMSSLQGYEVTVSGIVTADTSDLGNTVYIQDEEGGPWSGISLFGTEVLKFRKGDLVTVTGTVAEYFDFTELEDINQPSQASVVSSGNELPEAEVVQTGSVDFLPNGSINAEQWEGVLVKYVDAEVSNYNADGSSNYGEILVNDGSGDTRVELQDGDHKYHNLWDPLLIDDTTLVFLDAGTEIEEITGVMYYSFNNYKLIPRNNDDFVFPPVVSVDDSDIPADFALNQNYPNPFNPSTVIEFALPKTAEVRIRIFNILGQEIAKLIDETRNAGYHKVKFNASGLSSGLYFYSIDAGEFNSVRKMMLIK